MSDEPATPKFLSVDFHLRFFPGLLRDRIRRRQREAQGTTFTSSMEMFILLAVCLVLAAVGLPPALARGSVFGWILAALGIGGIAFLTVSSVAAQWGSRPTYDDFLFGFFFLCVSAGALGGVAAGMDAHSAGVGFAAATVGLAGGYALGIFTGLRMQHLGWIATVLNMLAGLGSVILAGTVLVLLAVLAWS